MFQAINVSRIYNILQAASFLKREGIILISSQLFLSFSMLMSCLLQENRKVSPGLILVTESLITHLGEQDEKKGCPAPSLASLPELALSVPWETSRQVTWMAACLISAFSYPLRYMALDFIQPSQKPDAMHPVPLRCGHLL